ncbi:MAG: type II toxin-antitoxin system RelE/ParE family toxin [Candidatus Gracilibacteria bacterium]
MELPIDIQERINSKLKLLAQDDNIFLYLKRIHCLEPATHRLRIGDYRLLIAVQGPDTLMILKIAHRKDIYRKIAS